jgi:hypothetical protein
VVEKWSRAVANWRTKKERKGNNIGYKRKKDN